MAIIAKVVVRAGHRDQAAAIFREAVEATADEPGTLLCRMHLDRDDPNTIWFYDEFTGEPAIEAHRGNPVIAQIGKRVAHLMAAPPEEHVIELVAHQPH